MYYNFDTDKIDRAKAALLLYGLYRSRGQSSSLNGLETWERFNSYVRAACIKSETLGEFVQQFCRKANIASIKPYYFQTGDLVAMPDGELILSDAVKDYRLNIFNDDSLLDVINKETLYLIMLIRERIQREKLQNEEVEN